MQVKKTGSSLTAFFRKPAKPETVNENEYLSNISDMGIFDSRYEESLPQTICYKLVTEHFAASLPEGKTVKKAIVLGYDGLRADGLVNIKDNPDSAVMQIKKAGGLYYTFAGGIPGKNEQATSTAPCFAAITTGGWGGYNGVYDNGQYKKAEAATFLTELARQGHAVSFTTSWREHTAVTYHYDTIQAIEEGLTAEYTHQPDDAGTLYQVLKYVAKPKGMKKTAQQDPDVIFFTLEYPDSAGHDSGFGNQNPNYVNACKRIDRCGAEIIKTIFARETYGCEDWLIIILTDHGGTNRGHGGQTLFERTTWLACNRTLDMSQENINFAKGYK